MDKEIFLKQVQEERKKIKSFADHIIEECRQQNFKIFEFDCLVTELKLRLDIRREIGHEFF